MPTFAMPYSSSASSISSYHTCFSERQPSTGSTESNPHGARDPDQNIGEDASPPRRPRIPFGYQESWTSLSQSSLSIDTERTTSSGFLAKMTARLSDKGALGNINVKEHLAKLEQKIEENRKDREVLREAVLVARKYEKWELAEKLVRVWGKVVANGFPLRGLRRKLRKRASEGGTGREEEIGLVSDAEVPIDQLSMSRSSDG